MLLAELIQKVGLSNYTDVNGIEHTPSAGFNFYSVGLDTVSGSPIEYASNNVTQECLATYDDSFLYIATKGTCSVGSLITI